MQLSLANSIPSQASRKRPGGGGGEGVVVYETDFSEFNLLQTVADLSEFSMPWASSESQVRISDGDTETGSSIESTFDGGKLLLYRLGSGATNTNWFVKYEEVSNLADVELLTLINPYTSFNNSLSAVVRATSNTLNRTGYLFSVKSSSQVSLVSLINGSRTDLGVASFSFSFNTWYWTRFRVVGNVLKGKIWAYGQEEPEEWTVGDDGTITDDNISSGGVGIEQFNTELYRSVDYVKVIDLSPE